MGCYRVLLPRGVRLQRCNRFNPFIHLVQTILPYKERPTTATAMCKVNVPTYPYVQNGYNLLSCWFLHRTPACL